MDAQVRTPALLLGHSPECVKHQCTQCRSVQLCCVVSLVNKCSEEGTLAMVEQMSYTVMA